MPGTILIVEDEADLAFTLEYALRREGFRTLAAASGQAALATIQSGVRVDLVLLDLTLPDMPGPDVCSALRASERTRHLPVIMMTARADGADVAASHAAGVDDCVIKPFRMHELVLRVLALRRRGAPAVAATAVHAVA